MHPATALVAAVASFALLLRADSRKLAERAATPAAAQLPFLLPPALDSQPVQLDASISEHLVATGGHSSSAPGSIATSGSGAETSSAFESCAPKVTEDACGDPAYTPPAPDASLPLHLLPDARPSVSKRRFRSALAEAEIERLARKIADPALRRIWMNSYPSSLDTTVAWTDLQLDEADHRKAFPRSFIITGDIEASWLRDSTSQLLPYLPLLSAPPPPHAVGDGEWRKLYRLVLGLIYMQSQFVITDPYANAFGPPDSANITHVRNPAANVSDPDADWFSPAEPSTQGHYDTRPNTTAPAVSGNDDVYIWESKWEVDSLASFLALPYALYNASSRRDFAHNRTWQRAVRLAIDTLRSQQRSTAEEHAAALQDLAAAASPPGRGEWQARFGSRNGGVYRFQRAARTATETRSDGGFGEPGRRTGMVKSAFRPSDDATLFPFLVPSNAYLAVALEGLTEVLDGIEEMADVRANAAAFAAEVRDAIEEHAVVHKREVPGVHDAGEVFAFEVDGYGSSSLMDDANVPSLLSLPYLGFVSADDPVYQRTRKYVLNSASNKWAFSGKLGSGIGGPHVGWGYAWPMSRSVQILTTTDADEQLEALAFLRSTTTGTGLIHESVNVNNQSDFTRAWFGWACGQFGQALQHVEKTNPALLSHVF